MPNAKSCLCSVCRRLTSNRAGLCTPCLNGGAIPPAPPPRLTWRRAQASDSGGFEGLPRTARLLADGAQRCGGGLRRLARPTDY